MTPIVLELDAVSKNYRGLRPLRVRWLKVAAGEQVAILGMDQPSAEVLINLITGATVPDQGRITAFGRSTADISDGADWLASVDRFGIVSQRAVLLDELDVLQNLSLPFTLEIEPPPADVRERAMALAKEVGLADSIWEQKVATLGPASRARIRLARALALDPEMLLMEHINAGLTRDEALSLGTDARAAACSRAAAIVAVTTDEAFARSVAGRVLSWDPASGHLAEPRRRWFRGLLG